MTRKDYCYEILGQNELSGNEYVISLIFRQESTLQYYRVGAMSSLGLMTAVWLYTLLSYSELRLKAFSPGGFGASHTLH